MKEKTFKNLKVGDVVTLRTWAEILDVNRKSYINKGWDGRFDCVEFTDSNESHGRCVYDAHGNKTFKVSWIGSMGTVEIDLGYFCLRQELREPEGD